MKPEAKEFASVKMQAIGGYCLLILCAFLALHVNAQKAVKEYESREQVNSRWEALMTYCKEHKEAYYVIDVYSSTSYDGVPYSEKIFKDVDNSYRNFDICGGWLSKSPLMYEKLAKVQIEDLESALHFGEQVYFVAAPDKDLTWLIDYYAFKGKMVTSKRIDTIYDGEAECFAIYRLQ